MTIRSTYQKTGSATCFAIKCDQMKSLFSLQNTHRVAILGMTIIWLMMTSCSIFETREPEEPGSTTVPVFIQPDRPQDVVQNLINAVRAVNVDNYRRCLSFEEFVYEPTSVAQSGNPDLWQGWGVLEEQTYFSNMSSETEGLGGHDLTFEYENYTPRQTGEEQFEADYLIIINHNRQGLPSEARGRIRLFIDRDEDGQWSIHSWSDASNGNDFSWSDFRVAFF